MCNVSGKQYYQRYPERSTVLELTILSENILFCRNGQRAWNVFMTYLHFKNTAKEVSNQSYTHLPFQNFTFEIFAWSQIIVRSLKLFLPFCFYYYPEIFYKWLYSSLWKRKIKGIREQGRLYWGRDYHSKEFCFSKNIFTDVYCFLLRIKSKLSRSVTCTKTKFKVVVQSMLN